MAAAESATAIQETKLISWTLLIGLELNALTKALVTPCPMLSSREDEGFNLESDADEQLFIYIPFTQVVKLHSIVVKGSEEEGPKTVKLFRNREHMGFSNVNDFPPSDTAGKPVAVKCVKFQNVRSLTIVIEDNQSGSEITKIQKTALYGSTEETTDMKGLKQIEEH
ncbi:hypothetical protein ES288_A11G296700v1 [Gossypium darwinii]|uniref:PITH domain-containing protein n=1 Tax=Gossypium darwinii TaxID=34276 RepID=A0A5D2ERA9_GOSDA|nr:hypothetical protein ES288_A11G296700v1 [Gossypium darwinii]